ncbi:chemotaxis response regulator protein-glutamate methylesterase [Thiohalophilus sp.]|uniref:protein-glutamate methylesterase/protein-glutamine glutaminase n=1 Tax=Thiohalophilus sp. TaxID=3028392 RepID=UPI0039762E9A
MATRVLVVDDSGFFRRRVAEILNADPSLEVVGQAENGEEAVRMTAELKPDVITMDIEMPVMDGITATRKIMQRTPTPVIMFSSLTTDGAKPTLDALEAGALDFLPKRFEDIARDRDEAKNLLCQRVRALGRKRMATPPGTTPASKPISTSSSAPAPAPAPRINKGGTLKLLAIGTSTGGPVALQQVLTNLPADFPLPIVLVQHMPATFTPAFARRLDQLCKINVKEAENGDVLKPGWAYLAPGGKQMLLQGRGSRANLQIVDADESQTYKPSVDITFESISKVYPGETLAVIMTGMGADGREGARSLKQMGSNIWAQDEASSVVYGMPAAVAEAGLTEQILNLTDIGPSIIKRVM